MGGLGSGRYHFRERNCIEDHRWIDVNKLKRKGCLEIGWQGNLKWMRDGEVIAWIGLRTGTEELHLSYRYRVRGGEWRDIEQSFPIVTVPCSLGGQRPYFHCCGVVSGVACQKRVVRLYGAGPYFLCRHCYGLSHVSQSENRLDRTISRARRLRQRIGEDPSIEGPLPQRPKGMWHRTYQGMLEKIIAADQAANDAFIEGSRRIIDAIDQRNGNERFW